MNARLGILFVLLLSGCPNFGDILYKWVIGNAGKLSVEHAKAELPDRWISAHQAVALGMQSRIHLIDVWLASISTPDENTAPTDALAKVSAGQVQLVEVELEIERALKVLTTWSSICSSRYVYEWSYLDRIGTTVPVLPYIEPNYVVEAHLDPRIFVDIFYSNPKSILEGSSVGEQNRKAIEAVAKYSELAIHGDQLFELSKNICEQEFKAFSTSRSEFESVVSELRKTKKKIQETFDVMQRDLESKVVPLDIADFLRREGLDVQIASLESRRYSDDVRAALLVASKTLSDNEVIADVVSDCESRVTAVETVEDQYVGTIAQIDTLLESPIGLDRRALDALATARTNFTRASERTRAKLARMRTVGCQ